MKAPIPQYRGYWGSAALDLCFGHPGPGEQGGTKVVSAPQPPRPPSSEARTTAFSLIHVHGDGCLGALQLWPRLGWGAPQGHGSRWGPLMSFSSMWGRTQLLSQDQTLTPLGAARSRTCPGVGRVRGSGHADECGSLHICQGRPPPCGHARASWPPWTRTWTGGRRRGRLSPADTVGVCPDPWQHEGVEGHLFSVVLCGTRRFRSDERNGVALSWPSQSHCPS